MITAEIINIGDELLIGQVINTNASWMAKQLNEAGIEVLRVIAISDKREEIIHALNDSGNRADVILLTGGLGPTRDDITKKVLAEYFQSDLVFNEKVFEHIKTLLSKRGFDVSKLRTEQAEIPANCKALPNEHGTAPGMWFEKDNHVFVSMPGVPYEMKSIVADHVIPALIEKFKPGVILHKTFLTQGVPESVLAKRIEDWEDKLPKTIKLAYLPQPGMVRLRLTARGNERTSVEKVLLEESAKLEEIISDVIFGYDEQSLESVIGNKLLKNKQMLATAESCTGGYIAHLITSIAGSSDYFKGSVVAYSNEIKENVLGVKGESLTEFGAVSEAVVIQMAEGVKLKFNTDFALAVSGIAGPSGGTEEKPVGTTWIALATPEKIIARKFLFGEHRERNIRKTALAALNILWNELK